MPPWAFPLRGLLHLTNGKPGYGLPSPLALSRLGRVLTSPPAPQGLYGELRSRSLSRPASPLGVSHLFDLLGSLVASQGGDIFFPSEDGPRRRGSATLS
jgi:hypothetical protein